MSNQIKKITVAGKQKLIKENGGTMKKLIENVGLKEPKTTKAYTTAIIKQQNNKKLNKTDREAIERHKQKFKTIEDKALKKARINYNRNITETLGAKKRTVDAINNFKNILYTTKNKNLNGLYKNVIHQMRKEGGRGYLVLHFKNKQTGRLEQRTIQQADLRSEQHFLDAYEELIHGGNNGSGVVNDSDYDLMTNIYNITYMRLGAYGSSENIFFKCKGITGYKLNNCVEQVLDIIEPISDSCTCNTCNAECVITPRMTDNTLYWACPNCKYELTKERIINKPIRDLNDVNDSHEKAFNHRKKELKNIVKLIEYVKEKNLKVNILANTISYDSDNKNQFEIIEQHEKNDDIEKLEYCGKNKNVFKPNINNYKLKWLYKNEEKIHTNLIWDNTKEHLDIIEGSITFKENLYMDYCDNIYLKNENNKLKKIDKPINLDKKAEIKTNSNHYYIAFDFETITDFDSYRCMKAYSLSISVANDEDLTNLNNIDEKNDEKALNKWKKNKVFTFVGYDCITRFFDWLCKAHVSYRNKKNNIFTLMSFNGSNFDNFFLLDALLNANRCDLWASDIFYNNNQLLKFTINGKNTVFDLAKHLCGSLKYNCDSFKVKLCAKTSFDHNKAQEMFNEDPKKLISHMKKSKELIEYNEKDVLSLLVIYKRYQTALQEIPATKEASNHLTNSFGTNKKVFSTIGSLANDCFNKNKEKLKVSYTKTEEVKEKIPQYGKKGQLLKKAKIITKVIETKLENQKIKFPLLETKIYEEMLKYKCAGRVELFNGIQEITEDMCSLDICSMYPFVMCVMENAWYPHGELIQTDEYNTEKIGFYYCDIDQTILIEGFDGERPDLKKNLNELQYNNLKNGNLPNIYAEKVHIIGKTGKELGLKENDYASKNILKNYLISSVMINQLRKYGCKVDIKKGFYFTEKIAGCELFEFLLEFMQKKNQQDMYKKLGDTRYNPALREAMKLLSNSVSGKLIEGLHLTSTEMLDADELISLYEGGKMTEIKEINIIGGKSFITYNKNIENEIKKQKNIYLGIMVYDYSKCYIFDTAFSIIGKKELVYTDTDSCKFRKRILENEDIKNYYQNTKVKAWALVDKYDSRINNHPLYSDKTKVYGSYEDEFESINYFSCFQKKSWVGINSGNHSINHMSFKGVPSTSIIIDNIDELKWVQHKKDKTLIIDPLEANRYYANNANKSIKNNLMSFCKKLHEQKFIYVLTYNFQRVVKKTVNTTSGDKLSNQIVLQSIIKKIVLNE